MSACLFTMSPKWFHGCSLEEIKKAVDAWQAVCDDFERHPEKQDNKFESDRYYGYRSNVTHGVWYLEGAKRNNPTPQQTGNDPMT